MGRPQQHDYNGLYFEYQHEEGGLKEFAQAKKISYDMLRKEFKKIERGTDKKAPSKRTKRKAVKKNVETDKTDSPEESALTEKQRLFCLFYIKNFNATQSALKVGYSKESAHTEGWRLLQNEDVRAEIKRLKGNTANSLMIEPMHILELYMKIAFADIGDYVRFGQKEVQAMGPFGPLTEKGNPVMKVVNFVDFESCDNVDTSIISEVKQGKDGVAIKLHDKMKALEKLEKFFDLLPDQHKRMVEDERLKMDREKLELEKGNTNKGSEKAAEMEESIEDAWRKRSELNAQR